MASKGKGHGLQNPVQPFSLVQEPYEPYPPNTYNASGILCPLGKVPRTSASTTASDATGARIHPPSLSPPPHSKRTVALLSRTINGLLLQSACLLSLYSGPPPAMDRPISLHDPLHPLLQALRKADQAYDLARAWHRFELIAKAHLFRGHAYRAIGFWDMAHDAYVRAASHQDFARNMSDQGLEALTRYCAKMRDGMATSGKTDDSMWQGHGHVKGLFRCGTFGDLGQKARDGAAETALHKQQEGRARQKTVPRLCKNSEVLEDAVNKEEESEGGGGRDEDIGNGDGEADGDKEIDWLAVGMSQSHGGNTATQGHLHLHGYPPLRSARGRLVGRTKLRTDGNL